MSDYEDLGDPPPGYKPGYFFDYYTGWHIGRLVFWYGLLLAILATAPFAILAAA